jgi:HD-like signal output (HDOD) protein
MYASANKVTMFDAENNQLGYSHTDIAECLTKTWNLPAEIRLSLIYHHTPSASVQCHDIIALCHLSDWLCYETGFVIDADYQPPKLEQNAIDRLKLQQQDIDRIKEIIPAELEKTSIFYHVASEKQNDKKTTIT